MNSNNPSQNDIDEGIAFPHNQSAHVPARAHELPTDAVNRPKHYKVFVNVEAIDLIASSMSEQEFHGYCMGNVLKYRLRAGKKGVAKATEDLAKADKYEALFREKRHLCRAECL